MAGRVFVGKAAFVMMMKNVKASKSANGKRCIVTGVLLPEFTRKKAEGLPFASALPFPTPTLMMIKCDAEFLGETSTHFVGQ